MSVERETIVRSMRISKSALPIIEREAKKNYRTMQKQVCAIIDEWVEKIENENNQKGETV